MFKRRARRRICNSIAVSRIARFHKCRHVISHARPPETLLNSAKSRLVPVMRRCRNGCLLKCLIKSSSSMSCNHTSANGFNCAVGLILAGYSRARRLSRSATNEIVLSVRCAASQSVRASHRSTCVVGQANKGTLFAKSASTLFWTATK